MIRDVLWFVLAEGEGMGFLRGSYVEFTYR
jgi:hypothetical protein